MDLSDFSNPNSLQSAAILTIVLAFIGYLATFLSARMLARRKDELDLVNKRLNEFYGPRSMLLRRPETSPTARCLANRAKRRAIPSRTRR
jgi:hypothetical protein